jgi:hypothetical protein
MASNNGISYANAKKLGYKGIQKQWESLSDVDAVAEIQRLNQAKAAKTSFTDSKHTAVNMLSGVDSRVGAIASQWEKVAEAETRVNGMMEMFASQMTKQTEVRRTVIQQLGQVGILQRQSTSNIRQAAIESERYGVTASETLDMVMQLSQQIGRISIINEDDIARAGIFAKNLGVSNDAVAKMVHQFDIMGVGLGSAIDKGNEMAQVARNMGVNMKSFMNEITDNMGMMNTMNFADGVQGFARMTAQATKLGLKMSTVQTMADKVMDPEGAIDLAANLQVLGGAMGDLADPMKMMYMATNDAEGLQEAIVNVGKDLATVMDDGSIGFSGTALRQLKALSEATGIQRDELAGMIKMQKKFEMMENQMDISIFGTGKKAKEMQEFVTSMATMGEDQKFEIELPGLGKVSLEDLTSKHMGVLEKQMAVNNKTEKEVAKEQTDLLETIARTIVSSNLAAGVGMMEGTQWDKFQNALVNDLDGVMETFNNNAQEVSKGFGEIAQVGLKSVTGTDIPSFLNAMNVGTQGVGTGIDYFGSMITTGQQAMIQESERAFEVQQGTVNIEGKSTVNVNGTAVNDETWPADGTPKAVLTSTGAYVTSPADTLSAVNLSAGPRASDLTPITTSNSNTTPSTINLKLDSSPIPLRLTGVGDMGNLNIANILRNPLVLTQLKRALEETNLTGAPDFTQVRDAGGITLKNLG